MPRRWRACLEPRAALAALAGDPKGFAALSDHSAAFAAMAQNGLAFSKYSSNLAAFKDAALKGSDPGDGDQPVGVPEAGE